MESGNEIYEKIMKEDMDKVVEEFQDEEDVNEEDIYDVVAWAKNRLKITYSVFMIFMIIIVMFFLLNYSYFRMKDNPVDSTTITSILE